MSLGMVERKENITQTSEFRTASQDDKTDTIVTQILTTVTFFLSFIMIVIPKFSCI